MRAADRAGSATGHAEVVRGAQRFRELMEIGESVGALPAMEFLGFVEQFNTIESALEVIALAGHPRGTVDEKPDAHSAQ